MKTFTLNEWKALPDKDKGLWTSDRIAADRYIPASYLGKRTLVQDFPASPILMTEGIHFIIRPTDEELETLAQEILDGIDHETIRGFHPWQFTGSAVVDDNSLLLATTRQDNTLVVEASFYTSDRPRYRVEIKAAAIRRICRYNKEALTERLRRLFVLMSEYPKKKSRSKQ